LSPTEIVFTGSIAFIIDLLWHMALPLATVVFVSFGAWTYITRNIVVGTLQEDFVMAARAKGLPERKIIYGHVLRSASPPIVTMSILSLIGSLGGAIITESVFTWPGMGRLYWIALQQGDLRVLLGLTFITTFIFVVAMVLVDLVYGFLDPRVKVGMMRR
jgi:peptide/nickel transport system permease protein